MNRQRRWGGSFAIGEGYGAYLGPSAATDWHAHHAVQVTIALAGQHSFLLQTRLDPHVPRRHWAVVPADEPHMYEGAGDVVSLYLDPETDVGRTLEVLARSGDADRMAALVYAVRKAIAEPDQSLSWNADGLLAAAAPAVATLKRLLGADARPISTRIEMDSRVGAALEVLRGRQGRPVPAVLLAAQVGLSSGRLSRLFKATTGMPIRRYVLWLRLRAALGALQSGGRSLSEAAHEAGFSDAAHLTRTFRRMFGIAPSELGSSLRA